MARRTDRTDAVAKLEKRFPRSFGALHEIFIDLDRFFTEASVDSGSQFAVKLAVEELFTNMVKYNAASTSDIQIELERVDNHLVGRLSDPDSEPFDITKTAEVRVDRPIEERRPGGLGIHLIKKLMDRVEYEYAGRRSTTTFFRNLE